jgi:class 3 adenylate cyclase
VHREFRTLLDKAVGTSEYVVVLIVDVRGFSTFSTQVDSADAGLYIKKVYARMIDDFFPTASFFKPTGDGLLLTLPYTEETLEETVQLALARSFDLVEEFATLVSDDRMITFEVPADVGIGIARGSASCLRSGDRILDYSGRILNLASRLMNLARPSGIVTDGSFSPELVGDHLESRLDTDHVYLPGIAEATSVAVRYSWEFTDIPARAKQPLSEYAWKTHTYTWPLKRLEDRAARHLIELEERPIDEKEIHAVARHPRATRSGGKASGVVGRTGIPFDYSLDAGRPVVALHHHALASALREANVKGTWPVEIEVRYPVVKDATVVDDASDDDDDDDDIPF